MTDKAARDWNQFAFDIACILARAVMGVIIAIITLLVFVAILGGFEAKAQIPGHRETPTETPSWRGTEANAPIPAHFHKRNEGGSDGAGLCVICSIKINGDYQGVPNTDLLWQTAKGRPGGYGPGKLQSLLDEVMPAEKWASYVGTDPTILHKLSALGYPIGSTMNTGALYGYRPIHHMISLVHFDRERDLACVVDNNQPGVYSWMTAREYYKRWLDGGSGWAFVWIRKANALTPLGPFLTPAILVAAGILLVVGSRLNTHPPPDPYFDSEGEEVHDWQ